VVLLDLASSLSTPILAEEGILSNKGLSTRRGGGASSLGLSSGVRGEIFGLSHYHQKKQSPGKGQVIRYRALNIYLH
jgi:hypothetical protein